MYMEVEFAPKIKKKAENPKKHLGKLEKAFKYTIDYMLVVPSLDSLGAERPFCRHKLTGDKKGMWAIRLSGNWRMILQPLDGEEAPSTVTKVRVIDIEDYH